MVHLTVGSLDLTQLGDLLMVLARSYLAAVKPTALYALHYY